MQIKHSYEWFMGISTLIISISMLSYYFDSGYAQRVENTLPYTTLYTIVIVLLFAMSLLQMDTALSQLIAKQLWKSEKFRIWYTKQYNRRKQH